MRNIFFLAVILILLYGCMDVIGSSTDYRSEYSKYLEKRIGADSEADECKIGNCTCMICQNKTAYLWSLWTSLAGGECFFQHPCDESEFQKYNNGTYGADFGSRNFMYGAGPSFFDFGESNKYCHGRQTMAVHWLIGNKYKKYDMPDAERAMCMLQHETIPVYVLYSGGQNIDRGRSYEIGEELGWRAATALTTGRIRNVGPVIVTTEINYDIDDADQVAEQIYQLNAGCGNVPPDTINCFVAVAPKMGDKDALDAVMNRLGADKEYVQMLAFGIDSHYSNGSCNPNTVARTGEDFAAYGLYEYGLPSVVPYVMFDQGVVDPITGCVWSEEAVQIGYQHFFPSGSVILRDAGVIGVAPYSFNSSQWGGDPLGCNDCDIASNLGRLESWYGGCQRFAKIDESRPGGGFPVVFPNESGGDCNYITQTDYFGTLWRDSGANVDILTSPVTPLEELENITWRCDACIVNNVSTIWKYYPVMEWWYGRGELREEICTAYPEIDYYASRFNVDPMLSRGYAFRESSFDHCSVAPLCQEDTPSVSLERTSYNISSGEYRIVDKWCDPATGYDKGFPEMEDPDGVCWYESSESVPPRYTFRGLGLYQSLMPPYTYWPAEYREDGLEDTEKALMFEDARAGGAVLDPNDAKQCFVNFNPFNITHAACLGNLKISKDLKSGNEWVKENSLCEYEGVTITRDLFALDGESPEKREFLDTFVGVYISSGIWNAEGDNPQCNDDYDPLSISPGECWSEGYCEIAAIKKRCALRDPLSAEGCGLECEVCTAGCCVDDAIYTCAGRTHDFIEYVSCRIANDYNAGDAEPQNGGSENRYGIFLKMAFYMWLSDNCENSFCPPYRQILGTDPTAIDKLNPDQIDETTGDIKDDPYAYVESLPGT